MTPRLFGIQGFHVRCHFHAIDVCTIPALVSKEYLVPCLYPYGCMQAANDIGVVWYYNIATFITSYRIYLFHNQCYLLPPINIMAFTATLINSSIAKIAIMILQSYSSFLLVLNRYSFPELLLSDCHIHFRYSSQYFPQYLQ